MWKWDHLCKTHHARINMTTWITVCDTCKREGWDAEKDGQKDGEKLAELVEASAANSPVKTRRVSCMMGCKNGCNIAIQADGKLCYNLGNFEVDQTAAQAIVDYATQHQESDSGQVPYRTWPEAIKGHFVSRQAPLPNDQ